MFLFFIWIIGAIAGSFAGMLIVRNNRNESIIFPQSHCDNCKQTIYRRDLIPIFSYIWLKGKCRFCHSSINKLSFILELGMSFLFVLSYLNFRSFIISTILLLLFYLSIEDCQSHFVSSNIIYWLAIISCLYHFTLLSSLIYISIYLLLHLFNHKLSFIGSADIDITIIMLNLTNYESITIIILVASLTCLFCYLFFCHNSSEMPFIPFLFLGYLVKICI